MLDNLNNLQNATVSIIDSTFGASVKSYLRGIAEKSLAICELYERKVRQGIMTRFEAIAATKLILKDSQYGKVGATGYIAALDSKGSAVMHPAVEGRDVGGNPAIHMAIAQKTGYLEYPWQNPGEDVPREKASYLLYFEPWDWILWASSYKSEFTKIARLDDIRQYLLNLKIGNSGYPYVVDQEGTLVIHPSLEGQNLYNTTDADRKFFIQDMINDEDGEGYMDYRWKNPDDLSPRFKFQHYKRLDNFGWIVAITGYTDDYFYILNSMLIFYITGFAIALGIIILVVHFMSNNINRSIVKTKEIIHHMAERLNQSFLEIKKSVKDSQKRSSNLTSHSNDVSTTVNEMSATMDNMRNSVANFSEELKTSSINLEEIKRNIASVNDLLAEQGISEVSTSMDETISGLQEMAAGSNQVTQGMTNLS